MKTLIISLIILNIQFLQAQESPKQEVQPLNLEQISLDGLDEDVKKVFQETKTLIVNARTKKDSNTEFTATKSWCLLLHNYDFLNAAKACYYKVGLDEKDNPKWPYLFGKASHDNGETEDAIKGFVETINRNNNYLPAHYYLAQTALEAGNLKTAFQRLSHIPVELKLSSILLKLSGDLYFEVENYYVSIGYYLQALQLVPEAGNLNYKIGRAYQALQQTDLAQEYLEKSNSVGILLIDPYFQEVKQQIVGEIPFLIKAKMALENGDPQAAIESYEKALGFNPNSESGLINIAVAYYQTKQIEKAKQSFESVLMRNPKQTKALFNLASILMDQNIYDSAIQNFQKYLLIIPNDQEAVTNLVQLYYQTRQYQKVLDLLSADNDIKTTELQFIKAKSMIQKEQFNQAVSLLKNINENDNNNIDVMLALAKIYSQVPDKEIRNAEMAFKYAEQAFQLNNNAQTYWQLLMALDEMESCDRLANTFDDLAKVGNISNTKLTSQFKLQRGEDLKCTLAE